MNQWQTSEGKNRTMDKFSRSSLEQLKLKREISNIFSTRGSGWSRWDNASTDSSLLRVLDNYDFLLHFFQQMLTRQLSKTFNIQHNNYMCKIYTDKQEMCGSWKHTKICAFQKNNYFWLSGSPLKLLGEVTQRMITGTPSVHPDKLITINWEKEVTEFRLKIMKAESILIVNTVANM